jgi:uncharacterized membrane protein
MAYTLDLILKQDARHRMVIGLAAASAVFFSLRGHVRAPIDMIVAWDTFAFFVLVLAWVVILKTPQTRLRGHAKAQDVSQLLISVCAVVGASVALFAVGFVPGPHKTGPQPQLTVHLMLTLGTVIFSWMLVHTVFGLRYAHVFYGDSDDPVEARHAGGLTFPDKRLPNYFDFAYYAFVIGMTCQVSDVQITSRKMRRLTLLHSVLSFGFNTVILALTVSSLL